MTGPDSLEAILPPAADPGAAELLTLEDLGDVAPAPVSGPKKLTPEDIESIEAHVDNLISTVAAAGADTVPPALRDQFEQSFTSSRLVRAGVQASGIGSALHELMPAGGEAAAGAAPIRQLHPVARVLLGLVVLGVGVAVQRKQVLSAYQTAASHASGAGGSVAPGVSGQVNVGPYGGA